MNRPTPYNVSIGDCLITSSGKELVRMPITEIHPGAVFASDGIDITGASYSEALIRKKDGTYLFGEGAEERIFNEGFGGIKVV